MVCEVTTCDVKWFVRWRIHSEPTQTCGVKWQTCDVKLMAWTGKSKILHAIDWRIQIREMRLRSRVRNWPEAWSFDFTLSAAGNEWGDKGSWHVVWTVECIDMWCEPSSSVTCDVNRRVRWLVMWTVERCDMWCEVSSGVDMWCEVSSALTCDVKCRVALTCDVKCRALRHVMWSVERCDMWCENLRREDWRFGWVATFVCDDTSDLHRYHGSYRLCHNFDSASALPTLFLSRAHVMAGKIKVNSISVKVDAHPNLHPTRRMTVATSRASCEMLGWKFHFDRFIRDQISMHIQKSYLQ
jgi:hypothetical protein